MLITATAIWGAGLALYLTYRSMECLGHLGAHLLQRPPRPRRRLTQNNLSRHRYQTRRLLSTKLS